MSDGNANILVVEDDGELLEILTYVFEDAGHHVFGAGDGESALKIGRAESIDLVILDIAMAGMSGTAVGQALRDDPETASVLIVVHTGLPESDVRREFADYDLFLAKADDADALCAAIATLIGERLPTIPTAAAAATGSGDLHPA